MNVTVKMFGEENDKLAASIELFRMKDGIISAIGGIMQAFGIKKVRIDVISSNIFPIITPKYKPYEAADILPDVVKDSRTEVVRNALRALMTVMGIHEIELTDEGAEEFEHIKNYWRFIADGTISDDVELRTALPDLEIPSDKPVIDVTEDTETCTAVANYAPLPKLEDL